MSGIAAPVQRQLRIRPHGFQIAGHSIKLAVVNFASKDGTANVWSTEGAGEPMVLEGHTGPAVAVSWSPRGDRILTASRDGTARVWRADTPDLIAAIRQATQVCLVAEFREKHLGDSPEEAQRHYLACAAITPE